MLKKLVGVILVVGFVFGLSGFGLAHEAAVFQEGGYNFAFLGQYSAFDNEALIDQCGIANLAVAIQWSPDNELYIGQHGGCLNLAFAEQWDTERYEMIPLDADIVVMDLQVKILWLIDTCEDVLLRAEELYDKVTFLGGFPGPG